jgi:hypothetical protein
VPAPASGTVRRARLRKQPPPGWAGARNAARRRASRVPGQFSDLVELAGLFCKTSIACISLVRLTTQRTW